MTRGNLSVFVVDAWVTAQKILLVQQLEKQAVTVESRAILVEYAKVLQNKLRVLRTLHNNGMVFGM